MCCCYTPHGCILTVANTCNIPENSYRISASDSIFLPSISVLINHFKLLLSFLYFVFQKLRNISTYLLFLPTKIYSRVSTWFPCNISAQLAISPVSQTSLPSSFLFLHSTTVRTIQSGSRVSPVCRLPSSGHRETHDARKKSEGDRENGSFFFSRDFYENAKLGLVAMKQNLYGL